MKHDYKVVVNNDSNHADGKTFDNADAAIAYAKTIAAPETVQVVHNADDVFQGVFYERK